MVNSILFIHPYFGVFPGLFKYWLSSCVKNPSIDFLIVTDQDIKSPSPNIIIEKTKLEKVKEKIEQILGFHVVLDKPYKLCDYRPIYHKIFQNHVQNYDFWGYCDSDMVLGDIRSFLTDELLNRFDYFLGMGHMHLQRTDDPKYEEVWQTSNCRGKQGGYQYVFTHAENLWFDELPHGVSAHYYNMFPDRMWSGFSLNGRCFEACDFVYKNKFIDTFNTYEAYPTSMYALDNERFPFWKREKGNDLYNIIYLKRNNKLYKVGFNENGDVEQREILYAHFYKRNLHLHSSNTFEYIIRPNAIVGIKKITPILLRWYSVHPELFIDKIKIKIKNRLYRHFHMKIR